MKQQIFIFDTTLRDGQQCPGAGISTDKNIEYALLAAKAKIDVLEAGFPSASDTDFKIVNTIAFEFSKLSFAPTLCGLCQLRADQIDKTIESLIPVKNNARVHIYLPVDPNLMEASLGLDKIDFKKLIELTYTQIKKVTDAGLQAEFSPEGYSRVSKNFDFCTELLINAVDAGAVVLNCPDTIGGASIYEHNEYFVKNMIRHKAIIDHKFPNNKVIWSTHCHNDLGLALSNSLNAVIDGPCRQIEGCINGIGERAGNVSLEQCIMVIDSFGKNLPTPLYTGIDTEMLKPLSDFISKHMLIRQPHWPIFGENATKHSSGGHTNAILSNPLAYQPFDPKKVGKEISFTFGPLSGSNHAQRIINDFGYICDDLEKTEITQFIKNLYADRRKGITDEELILGYKTYRSPIRVDDIEYSRSKGRAKLVITGTFFDRVGELTEEIESADSALSALKTLIDRKFPGLSLELYSSHSSDPTIHAMGLSKIILKDSYGNLYEGHGQDRDTQLSAMKALIDATNLAYINNKFKVDN